MNIKTRYAFREVDESILSRISEQDVFDWIVARLKKESENNIRSIEIKATDWKTLRFDANVDFTIDLCVFSHANNLAFGEGSIADIVKEVEAKDRTTSTPAAAESASTDEVPVIPPKPDASPTPVPENWTEEPAFTAGGVSEKSAVPPPPPTPDSSSAPETNVYASPQKLPTDDACPF